MAIRPYKRQHNRWLIDISMGRKARRKIVFDGTREAAYLHELALKKHLKIAGPDTRTIAAMAADYLEWVQLHQSPKTWREKRRMLYGALLLYFGNQYPDLIDRQQIDMYQRKRKAEIASKMAKGGFAMINKELLCLSHLIKWAWERRLCIGRLTQYDHLKYRRPLPDILTQGECISFLNAAPLFWRAIFLCMYQAGLRKNETLTLTRDHVRLEARIIIVKGKGDKERAVPIGANLYDALCDYSPSVNGTYLFPNGKTGQPYTDIRKAIARIKAASGIQKRLTPHTLRHSFGAHLVSSGINLRTIQELLGHADSHTTELYTQVNIGYKKTAVDSLKW